MELKKTFNHFLQNWKSGLTVALISIPLALALAIASGATPTQGIITAFWAGIIGASLGGSHYNIIGPTGALSGVLVSYSLIHGYHVLSVIALLSGLFIFICYMLRFDKYIIFIPKSVIHGFTLGVAFIIALGQIDNILGLKGIEKSDSFLNNTWMSLNHISDIQWIVFIIFLISTLLIFIWDKKFPKFPGSVIMAFLGILITIFLQKTNSEFHLITLGDQYPNIQANLFINIFSPFDWSIFLHKSIWTVSITVAVIAILETLLSGQIARDITKVKFNRSKEILSLSMANIGSGLMGGIPATAALARTALNIKSGAKHRTSGIISSLLIGFISIFLFSFFKLLPTVIIASILFIVAVRMIEAKHFIRFIEDEKTSFFLSLLVAVIVVVEDPIIGIIVGTLIALLIFVNKVSYGETDILLWKNGKMTELLLKSEIAKRKDIHSDLVVYKISGTLTYINMPAHLEAIKKITNNEYVIISLRHAFYADLDGIEYLKELIEELKRNNKKVYLSGINKEIHRLIVNEQFYKQKQIEKKIYNRTSEAIYDIYKK